MKYHLLLYRNELYFNKELIFGKRERFINTLKALKTEGKKGYETNIVSN